MKDVRHFRNSMKHTIYETKTIFIGDDMYYHYIYKIVNNINNKYYIGVHSCKSLERDKYAGSGYALQEAYAKYGIDNFTKHILQFFNNETEMYEKESILVNDNTVKNENSYNLKCGGKGGMCGYTPVYNPITNETCIMKTDDERYLNKIFISTSCGNNNPNYGKERSEEFKEKMKIIMKGKLSGVDSPFYGTHRDQRICDKIKKSKTGKICVNKDGVNKYIDKNELDIFLSNGYEKGPSKESIQQLLKAKESKNYHTTNGRIWITNGTISKLIKSSELENYLNNGFIKGRFIKN